MGQGLGPGGIRSRPGTWRPAVAVASATAQQVAQRAQRDEHPQEHAPYRMSNMKARLALPLEAPHPRPEVADRLLAMRSVATTVTTGSMAAVPSMTAFGAVTEVTGRVGVKRRLASHRAEVVRLTLVDRRSGRLRRLDVHPADRIFHGSPSRRLRRHHHQRPHRGDRRRGRTPAQIFMRAQDASP